MYDLRILDVAESDLARLDRSIARRIVARVHWLAEHLGEFKPEPLTGTLSGFFKPRVGDYRVIYRIIPNENLIAVHRIRHRREVYR